MTTAPVAVFGQVLNGGTDRFAVDIQIGSAATPADHLTLRITTQNSVNGQRQTVDLALTTATQAPNYHFIVIDRAFYDIFDLTTLWYYNEEASFTSQGGSPAKLIALQLLDNGQVIDTLGNPAGTTPALADNTTLTRNAHFFAPLGAYSPADYTVTPNADYGGFDHYTLTIPPAGTVPSVVSMQVVGADHGTSDTATFQVTFSQAVHGVTTSSFVLQNPQGGSGTVSAVESPDLITWTVHVSGLTGAGAHELALANGMSGIAGTYAAPLTSQPDIVADYVVDSAAPVFDTVTAITIGDAAGLLNAGDTVTFHVSTTTAATPSADADVVLTLSNGVVLHATAASLQAGTTNLVFTYTIGQGGTAGSEDTASLTVQSVALTQGTLDDGVGHAATFALSPATTFGLSIDTVAPALQFVGIADNSGNPIAANSALRAGETVRLELHTSEPLQNTAGISLELSNGAMATLTGTSNDGQSLFFTYTVQAGEDAASLSITGLSFTQVPSDAAGNPVSSVLTAGLGISVDTVAPVVAITGVSPDLGASASDGITLTGHDLVLSGTAETGSTVMLSVTDAGGTRSLGTVTAVNGAWAYDLGAVAAGVHAYTATVSDVAGNAGTASLNVTVAEAVVSPVLLGVGSDALHLGATTGSSAPGIFGTTAPGSSISVSLDGTPVGTATVDAAGNWFLSAPVLVDGPHSVTATATGLAGDIAPAVQFSFTVDTHGPVATGVTVLSSTGMHDNVLLPGDTVQLAVAFDEPLVLSAPLLLQLSNGAELPSLGIGPDGRSLLFSYTVPQGQGAAALQAVGLTAPVVGTVLADALGNQGDLTLTTTGLGLSIHTAVPEVPALFLADADGHPLGGTVSATGSLVAALQDAGDTLEYAVDGGAFSSVAPVFARDGTQDGVHTVSVRAVDAYGLTSAPKELSFTLDTLPPVVTGVALLDSDGEVVAPGSLLKAGDQVTIQVVLSEQVTFADPNPSLLLSNGSTVPSLGVSPDGRAVLFDYTVQFGDDAVSLAVQTLSFTKAPVDAAGNPLSAVLAADLGIAVDTLAPAIAIAGVSPDLGASASDGITFASRDLLLSGTAEAGSTVLVSEADATGTHVLGTASMVDGQWSYGLGAALASGQHRFVVSATDQAGNTSTATLPVTVAAAATTPLILGIGSDALHLGTATSSGTPAVFGQAAPGSTVAVTIDGRVVGNATADETGAWSLATGALADGTHLLVTKATGIAGDIARGTPFAFQVDTHGPAVAGVMVASTTGTHGSVLVPGDTAHLAVTFNEAVSLTGTLFLHLSNGDVLESSGTGADGKSVLFDYTVQAGQDVAALQAVSITADQDASIVDILGNVSALVFAPTDLGLSVHATSPAAPTLALADTEGHAVAGTISATGALAADAGNAGSTLEYSVDGGAFGSTAPVFAQDGSHDGQHTVSVRAVDAYGLASGATDLTFTLDTIAPAVALTDLSLASAGGNDRITLGGTLEAVAGTTVRIFDADTDLGAATLDGHGGWSFAATLAAGSHALQAVAMDAAGNTAETLRLSPLFGDTVTLPFTLAEAPISHTGTAVSVELNGVHVTLQGIGHFQFTDGVVDQADGDAGVDDLYYFLHNPDVWAAHLDPEQHYQQFGWKEGRDPNAYFSTSGYLAANPDVAAAGMNPLAHYEEFGWKEGRDASINFDTTRYLAANPDVAAAGMDPLIHFLTYGQAEGRAAPGEITHNGFDVGYYLAANPDVAASGMDAWTHFAQFGAEEGRNPNALFNTNAYLAAYPDIAASGLNPLDYYDQIGWRAGQAPGTGFDTAYYEAANSDVAAAGINPLAHYLAYGFYEGRSPVAEHSVIG